ncbi:MAG TPA: hypothetical protein VMC79_15910 [Rectinemataceae bacterium]|nr:hypothetical protein [Rectinemataceae bacterium]
MNQDQVKTMLLDCAEPQTEFSLIFSGKESAVVNGLYKPATREIIIHNRNFTSDDQLIYTALHEYAHHLHCERKGGLASGRAHTNEFWAIFHELLLAAESRGHYRNLFEVEPEFVDLTRRIKERCLSENGKLMLEFGRLMIEAQTLCHRFKARFEDYVDRALGVPRATASSAVRAVTYDVDPGIGWDGMRMASSIGDPGLRAEAVEALQAGSSPAAVRSRFISPPPAEDSAERLVHEKERLERSIARLGERLAEVEERLAALESGGGARR